MKKKSFTLIELIAVVIIIGILSTLAFTHYGSIKEKTLDKEAIANLKLMQAAEKIYKMEVATYYPASGSNMTISAINDNLKLSLPAGQKRNWNYGVWYNGCVNASRTDMTYRKPAACCFYFKIDDTDGEPNKGSNCP